MSAHVVRMTGAGDGDAPQLPSLLAEALLSGDQGSVRDLLTAGRRQLQEALEDELHRLVGELMVEVSAQVGLREKTGRAIALGTGFIDALPPPRVLRHLEDTGAFIARCRAACAGVITFLAGELNRGLEADGRPGVPPAMARRWVEECTEHLRIALERTEEDGIDRRAQLAAWFVGHFDGERGRPVDFPPTWLV